MNHHYPDSYHGYGHNTTGMPSLGYGGGYGDPATMARMVHPREGYQMSHYQMMQQPGGIYSQGGFIGQQGGNPYGMAGYSNYGISGLNQSVMMNNRQGDVSRISGGNMVNPYYSPSVPSDAHTTPHHGGGMSSQPSSYSHSQTSPHVQQPHMSMMSGQSHHAMSTQPSVTTQPIHGQSAHNTSHSMSQVTQHQGSGYGSQNSAHLMPRAHHVPQHPMRHPATQQNPQEVADNILQMASSYPSNQTVQVPLKNRPAPYHIPRSPHYMSHNDHPHTSPNPHLQPQPSPVASCQASPSPSSSSVKSPTPVLAPIPNPIPSPGVSGLRSPCNQGMSPCGTQRSPAHMGSSYSGHSQSGPPTQCGGSDGLPLYHGMSPVDCQHYSPCSMTQTNFSPFSVSTSVQRNSSLYSPSCDPSSISSSELRQPSYPSPACSSPCSSNLSSYTSTPKHTVPRSTHSHPGVSTLNMGSNPLMSLQKLVMLPETQVVDPKSVVNDTCLSSQQSESPKNVNGPAERLVESSGHSVGFQGQFSSLNGHPQYTSQAFQLQNTSVDDARLTVSTNSMFASLSGSQGQEDASCNVDVNNSQVESSDTAHQNDDDDNKLKTFEINDRCAADTPVQNMVTDISPENVIADVSESEQKFVNTEPNRNDLDNKIKFDDVCSDNCKVEPLETDKSVLTLISSPISGVADESTDLKSVTGEKSEKIMETDNMISLHPFGKKNGRIKEDSKCLIVQCRSPSVLSEMPVMSNGLSNTSCGNDDDLEQDCGNGVHSRIQKALTSLVKTKFAQVKKMSQFSSVTPCSIAVGADEQTACERFTFRRNGMYRSMRTTRMCNGRNRNDSTGNGDSDESLENVSENSFGLSESPQDGNKKRASAVKRSDRRKPNLNSFSANSEASNSNSKSAEPMKSESNGCVSYGGDIISDEDTCYYEGVDSSDIFINNCSSDESVTSNGDTKQNNNLLNGAADMTKEQQDSLLPSGSCNIQKEQDEKSENADTEIMDKPQSLEKVESFNVMGSLSPPSKKLRRSSGQKSTEKCRVLSVSRNPLTGDTSKDAETVIDLTCESLQEDNATSALGNLHGHVASNYAVRNQNRGSKFRPLILGHRSDGKSPVVLLDKSSVSATSSSLIKQEAVDHSDKTVHAVSGTDAYSAAINVKVVSHDDANKCKPQFKQEDTDFAVIFNDSVKDDDDDEIKDANIVKPVPIKSRTQKRKRSKVAKNKCKVKVPVPEKINRDAEIRQSFKSMKFSRTLDLMKARSKREQTALGPFVRISGKQSAPDSVTVFTQPVHESSLGLSSGKHKHSKSGTAHPVSSSTTVQMVTNLPTDKAAMVSSSRTISHNPWVCAFCAHHSSYKCLGDLFGPYFKESEIPRVESIAAEESNKGESTKDLRSSDSSLSRRTKDSFPLERKSYRKGRSPLLSKSEEPGPPPEEVWVHEACAMWSPGVYLIGNKLYGLDEAVKDAAETVCSACKSKGAMIGCLHKGCSMKYHFICAIEKDCYMDEEKLSLLCPKHKSKRLKSTESTIS